MLLLISTAASRVVQGQESDQATRQFAVAVGFQNQKLYDSAIEEWQAFIAKFPQDPRLDKASHYLGTCQLQAKQYPASIASFEKVLAAYPKFELLDQTILNLGTAWYSIAQESKACCAPMKPADPGQTYRLPRAGPPAAPPVPGGPLVGVPPILIPGVVPGTAELLGLAVFPADGAGEPRLRSPGRTLPVSAGA